MEYATYQMNSQLFVSKYQLYLPSAEELRAEIERERDLVVRERMERYGAEKFFLTEKHEIVKE